MSDETQALLVKINGADLDPSVAAELAEIRVEQSVHRGDQAVVAIHDPTYAVTDTLEAALGTALEVRFADDAGAESTVFRGKILGIGVEDPESEIPAARLVIEAGDGTHLLDITTTVVGHLNKKHSDIATEIAGRHGLEAAVDATSRTYDHLLQSGTDREMLDRMAAVDGFEWFVGDGKLHYRARPAATAATLRRSDGSLLRFAARYEASRLPREVTVTGWQAEQQASVAATEQLVAGDQGTDASLFTAARQQAGDAFQGALKIGTAPVATADEATAAARSLRDRLARSALRMEGSTTGNPAIRAGTSVEVEEVGQKLSGTYYVTDVVHEYGEGQVRTRFATEPAPRAAHTPPSDERQGWGLQGLVIGQVTNINDEEHGYRVKVTFPSLGPDNESEWARVVTLGAGRDRGVDIRPEVNDEVLVGFERGDTRFPFVLGGVFSSSVPAPHADANAGTPAEGDPAIDPTMDAGDLTRWEIASRGGHRLTMSDGSEKFVRIALGGADPAETFLTLSEEGVTLQAKARTKLVLKAGDASLTLADDGTIELAGKAITIDAGQDPVTVTGDKLDVTGASGIKLESGTGNVELKGMNVKATASVQAEIKGTMVKIN